MQPRKALVLSLGLATLLNLAFAALVYMHLDPHTTYMVSCVIWFLDAFASAFVFWTAILKAIRMIGTEEEQGRMYGIYYAANGTTAAVVAAVNLWAYNLGGGDANMQNGFFKKDLSTDATDQFHFSDVFAVLKMPAVWIVSIIMFCTYGVYSCASYFTPYLTDVVGFSTTLAGVFSVIRTYVVMLVAAPLGGWLADKVFKSTLAWFRVGGAILGGSIVLVILLGTKANAMLIGLLTLIPGLFAMCLYGVQFSTMHEVNIPIKVAGTAIGIASIIGYLPDMFLSTWFGKIIENNAGASGYFQIFWILAFFCVVIVLGSAILYVKYVKPTKAK